MAHLIDKDAVLAEIEKIKSEYPSAAKTLHFELDNLIDFIDAMQEVPIILTEEILKKNGFKLYAPPRYKEAFWSKIYEDKEENEYVFNIYMDQIVEHLLTVTPLATSDGKGHPDCHLPHPKTVQQLQNSLRLFGIEDIIRL